MNPIRYLVALFAFVFITASCGCRNPKVLNNTVTHEIVDTVHDTVFVTRADSSQAVVELKVDSLGRISIVPKSQTQGRYLSAPTITLKDNVVTVDCNAKAQELFFEWKSRYEKIHSQSQEIVEVEAKLSTWQHIQIWLGRILLFGLVVALTALFVNYKFNKSKS